MRRYEVEGVLQTESLAAASVPWVGLQAGEDHSTILLNGDVQAIVAHSPFSVTIQRKGTTVAQFNALGQFTFEHTRTGGREEGDLDNMWVEKVRTDVVEKNIFVIKR